MKLKNYTSSVPAERTISEIEHLLAEFGADKIAKEVNSDASVSVLSFMYQGNIYKLPANVEGVKMMLTEGKRTTHGTDHEKNRNAQAYRTVWRIIKDWLHVQLSLIASGQAQPDQILLPYMWDGKRTLYEAYKERKSITGDSPEKRRDAEWTR